MSHTASLELRRHWFTLRSTTGTLLLDGGDIGFALEPPRDRPQHPCIPVGTYRVTPYLSPKFSRMVLAIHDVPGRDAIEMHPGNFPWETVGCLLPGLGRGDDRVEHSVAALDAVLRKLDGAESIALTVVEEPWVTVS